MDLSIQTNWQNKTKGQKVATVAAGVAGAAAVASVVVAGVLGKGKIDADTFEGGKIKKLGAQLGEGYKTIGGKIVETATKGWGAVKELAGKVFHKAEKAAEVAEGAAEEAAAVVEEAVQ